MASVSELDRRRDQAVTAVCLAAAAWGDPDMPVQKQGKALLTCLGVLAAAHRPGCAPTMAELRAGLNRPLRELLPEDLDPGGIGGLRVLDVDGQISDEARDLCVEHLVPSVVLEQHWSWAKVSAEQEERRIYEVLRRLPGAEYTRARELLVEQPSGDVRDLRRSWDGLWGRIDVYEDIAEWTWCQVRGWWYPCPMCQWPMRVRRGGAVCTVRCEAHARFGVAYTCREDGPADRAPGLQPAGVAATEVKGKLANADARAVSRVAWRYVTLPGKLECELRDHARGVGAEVVMWPHKDRYDLRVSLGELEWRIDAKAWSSPDALGRALRGSEPAEPGLIIVIPDYQRASRGLLADMLSKSGYRVLTAQKLEQQIDKAAGVKR